MKIFRCRSISCVTTRLIQTPPGTSLLEKIIGQSYGNRIFTSRTSLNLFNGFGEQRQRLPGGSAQGQAIQAGTLHPLEAAGGAREGSLGECENIVMIRDG